MPTINSIAARAVNTPAGSCFSLKNAFVKPFFDKFRQGHNLHKVLVEIQLGTNSPQAPDKLVRANKAGFLRLKTAKINESVQRIWVYQVHWNSGCEMRTGHPPAIHRPPTNHP
jgi:hypothetical protein